MNIKGKAGSKERLLEMMQGVNKVTINESAWQERLNNTVSDAFQKLKSGALKIDQGGSNRAIMQSVDDKSYVGINGYDAQGNAYNFNFRIEATEGDQDGVGYVNDVVLEEFSYTNPQGQKVFDVNEDDLRDFNNQHGSELYDVIEGYMDTDTQAGEELDEEIKKKEESDPYGGSSQDYQDHMGYGDEKPVNSKLRVKASELEKFINENENGEDLIKKNFKRLTSDLEFSKMAKAYENLLRMKKNEYKTKKSTQFALSSLRDLIADYLREDKELDVSAEDVQNFFADWLSRYSKIFSEQQETPALDVSDVDDDGDKLEGGLGDESDVEDFDPDQIIKGIEVEMEHTKDPQVALEITMDHLRELPDYYTRLEKMEKSGKENIGYEKDDETDELADTLLGYDTQTPNKLPEDYDYAAHEREYEDKRAYQRFQELDSKPFESLSDEEKEEYYELWKEFGDI